MTNRPRSVTLTLALMLLAAAAWLAFGVIVIAGLHPAMPDWQLFKQVLGYTSLATAVLFVCLFIFLKRRARVAWYLALALTLGTCVATLFDDVGAADLTVIAVSALMAGLLLKGRLWYLRLGPRPAAGP